MFAGTGGLALDYLLMTRVISWGSFYTKFHSSYFPIISVLKPIQFQSK
jgi:hypothetical protein